MKVPNPQPVRSLTRQDELGLLLPLLLMQVGTRSPLCSSAMCTTVVSNIAASRWKNPTLGSEKMGFNTSARPRSTSRQTIGIFGPQADKAAHSPEVEKAWSAPNASGHHLSVVPIPSEASWGKASSGLVLALIALDRNSSHLAERIAVKSFLPVGAISSDRPSPQPISRGFSAFLKRLLRTRPSNAWVPQSQRRPRIAR